MLYNYEYFLEKKVNKIDLDIVYNKYYTEIDFFEFQKIVGSDPTSTIDGKLYMGKYSKWLLKLYQEKKLKTEDLYKVEEYVLLFDKQSIRNKLPENRRNIMNYNSLGELAKELNKFKDDESILSNSEKKDKNFIKGFKNYDLFIPRTFEDSCRLGKGTEWCTATEKTPKYFNEYHKPGKELLIFVGKEVIKRKHTDEWGYEYYRSYGIEFIQYQDGGGVEKFQFHFNSGQFMDKYDDDIELEVFLLNNPDIDKWLKANVNERDYKKTFYDTVIYSTLKQNYLKIPKHIEGHFECMNERLIDLKGCPSSVAGSYYCSYNELVTLEGCPKEIGGDFECDANHLTTLEHGPETVGDFFSCYNNKLTSLVGGPKEVGGGYHCDQNELRSLKGSPKKMDSSFHCTYNELISLVGGPKEVGGDYDCSNNNKLTSLKGAPKKVGGYFDCSVNKLTSLKGGPERVEGDFDCSNNILESFEGCPKYVGGNFVAGYKSGTNKLTEKDLEWLKKNCEIKGKIKFEAK